jgi:hypothetical protein
MATKMVARNGVAKSHASPLPRDLSFSLPLYYINQLCKAKELRDNLDDTVAHYEADIATV